LRKSISSNIKGGIALASAIVEDRKYEETKYRYKKETIDTSDINIKVGSKIFIEDKLYGTIVRESEIFYYIQKDNTDEPYIFMKESIKDKVANNILVLVD
jgi:hypothetical protein